MFPPGCDHIDRLYQQLGGTVNSRGHTIWAWQDGIRIWVFAVNPDDLEGVDDHFSAPQMLNE